jgi:hypothetical protein
MTTPSIYDRVHARSDLDAYRAAKDIYAIADALNADGLTAPGSRFVTMLTIINECADAADIIGALVGAAATRPALYEVIVFLRRESGMDAGASSIQVIFDGLLADSVLTSTQHAQLVALSALPVIVTPFEVADALYYPDGTER